MVDGLSLCSCICVTCLWCSLLAVCFPKIFKKLQDSDSSVCCAVDSNTRKNISRVIERCKSSVNDIPKTTSHEPKCTVRIIRKTRLQCPRKKSEEKLKTDTSRYCDVNYTETIDTGVQTDFYQRLRSARMQAHPEGNKRYKFNARLNRRENCSDESLICKFERGERDGREETENGIKTSKLPAKYRKPILYHCDDDRRCR